MNWLIYIGGGILWFFLIMGILVKLGMEEDSLIALTILSVIASWVWICLKFIK